MAVVQKSRIPEQFPDAKAFPDDHNPRVAVGDNRPPMDVEARSAFDEAVATSKANKEKIESLIGASDRARAFDDESAGRCGELVKQIRTAITLVNEAHKTSKQPYLDAGRAVDGAKNELIGPLEDAKKAVERKQSVYLNEQDQKRQAEIRRQREAAEEKERIERERLAATGLTCQEASPLSGATYIPCSKPASHSVRLPNDGRAYNMCDACAYHNIKNRGGIDEGEATTDNAPVVIDVSPAPAPEPEREVIRGDYGATVSGKREWKSQVTDYEIAFMAVSNNEKVREAIDKAIANMVRGGVRSIEGVRVWDELKASNR